MNYWLPSCYGHIEIKDDSYRTGAVLLGFQHNTQARGGVQASMLSARSQAEVKNRCATSFGRVY